MAGLSKNMIDALCVNQTLITLKLAKNGLGKHVSLTCCSFALCIHTLYIILHNNMLGERKHQLICNIVQFECGFLTE